MSSAHVPPPSAESPSSVWLVAAGSLVRAAFGVIWAIDAYLAWRPDFAAHYVGYLHNAAQGQPGWLQPWFVFWLNLVTPNVAFFVVATRAIETVIAIALLTGLARRWTYLVGLVFSLLVWATADGFGGPYVAGASNLGPALVYVLLFLMLIAFNRALGDTPYSLDYYLGYRWPFWRRFAEWGPYRTLRYPAPHLAWTQQLLAIVALVALLVFFVGTLQSALAAPAATPSNAASAVTPLSLASSQPVAQARDAQLPPLLGTGNAVDLNIIATDSTVEIASGVSYLAWTFGGTVPGPTFHVRQGQTINVTFTNKGMGQHSIDFHAAQIAPDVAYREVNAGDTIKFSWVAEVPGAYLYHCGTPPPLLHIGNGMYGAIIVDPATPLPAADASYVLVQGEWYTQQSQGTTMAADFAKMQIAQPDEVVFNGVANQYKDHPLPAHANKRVRFYVVDAGPNLASSFHVIGAIFAAVYPDGDSAHALNGVQTYPVAPGQGVVFDLVIPQPGKYVFVDHSMRDVYLGAAGVLDVTP
jgi:nitrite reductase (NO-forming)